MEEFYPSEIARLVLGYLKEMKCEKSWMTFMQECSDLSEYFRLFQRGKVYPTNVNWKSLSDILGEYCCLKRDSLNNSLVSPKDERNSLENNVTINKNIIEKLVKSAVDQAFHQHFPSACKSISNNFGESIDITENEAQKDQVLNKNIEDLHRHIDSDHNKEANISSNSSCELFSCDSPQFSITDVISLGNTDSSMEETNFGSSKDKFHVSPKNESDCMLDVIKVEADDPVIDVVTNIHNRNTSISKTLRCKDTKSANGCNVHEDLAKEKKSNASVKNSLVSDFELSDIRENADSSGKEVCLLNSKSNLISESCADQNFESNQIVPKKSLDAQNNILVSSVCNSNNIEVKENSSLISVSKSITPRLVVQDNVINTLNSPNNQSTFIVTPNSVLNQCVTPPLTTVPTYLLSNFPSSNCFLQNNPPFHIVVNGPNGLPMAIPNVSGNISNPIFTASNSTTINENSFTVPASTSNVPSIYTPLIASKNPTAAAANEKGNVTRKIDEELLSIKNNTSSVEASKINLLDVDKKEPAKKSVKKKLPIKENMKTGSNRRGTKYQKRTPKRKLINLFQSPPKATRKSPAKRNVEEAATSEVTVIRSPSELSVCLNKLPKRLKI